MDPFSKFVMARINPNGAAAPVVYGPVAPPVLANPTPAYVPQGYGGVNPFAGMSAGQLVQIRQDGLAAQAKAAQDAAAVQAKAAQDKAIRDAAVAAAYADQQKANQQQARIAATTTGFGGVPFYGDPTVLTGASANAVHAMQAAQAANAQSWAATTPLTGGPNAFNAVAGDPNGPSFAENLDKTVIAGGGNPTSGNPVTNAISDAASWAAQHGLPYIDKPRQISTGQMGDIIHAAANGQVAPPQELMVFGPAAFGIWAGIKQTVAGDKDTINKLYDQGAEMGGGSSVDPSFGYVVTTPGQHVSGGRAVYEKYVAAASDNWPVYVRAPFRVLVDTAADPLTYALPGATKAGEALAEGGRGIVESSAARMAASSAAKDAAAEAAAKEAAQTAAASAAETAAKDAGQTAAADAAATAAKDAGLPNINEVAPGGQPWGPPDWNFTDPSATPRSPSAGSYTLPDWLVAEQAAAKALTPEEISAARELAKTVGGYAMQFTGKALQSPQEVLDLAAKIVVGGPIKVIRLVLRDLSEPAQQTLNNWIRRDAASAASEVANAPEQQIANSFKDGARPPIFQGDGPRVPVGLTQEQISRARAGFTQAEQDARREINRGIDTGSTTFLEPIGDLNPPKRWTANDIQLEKPGTPFLDAQREAAARNANGPRAAYDAANTYTGPINADVAPVESAPVGETAAAPATAGPMDVGGAATTGGPVDAPVSVGKTPLEEHLTPQAIQDIAATPAGATPSWWEQTPEQRHAAIQRGEVNATTPRKGGGRIVDQVFEDMALKGQSGDPIKQAQWQTFLNDYQPKARAYNDAANAVDAASFKDFEQKKAVQAVMEAEHVVNDVVPAYVKATDGQLPEIGITRERAIGPKGGKVSFAGESTEYLVQRAVYSTDPIAAQDALHFLDTNRWAGTPWRDELVQRLTDARARVEAIQAAERGDIVRYRLDKSTIYSVHENGDELKVKGFQSSNAAKAEAARLNAELRTPSAPAAAAEAASVAPVVDAPPAAVDQAAPNVGPPAAPAQAGPAGYGSATIDKFVNDVGKYQMRDAKFDEQGVQTIIDGWNPDQLEALQVADNGDGTFTVLGGHNRQEAIRRMTADGTLAKDFQVPYKIVRGTDAQIRDVALRSNNKIPLKPTERARAFKMQLANGTPMADVVSGSFLSPAKVNDYLALDVLPQALKDVANREGDKSVGYLAELGREIESGFFPTPEDAFKFYEGRVNDPNGIITKESFKATIAVLKNVAKEASDRAAQRAAGAEASGMIDMFGGMSGGLDFGSRTVNDMVSAAEDLVRERETARRLAAGYRNALADPLMDPATRAGLTKRLPEIQASIHSLEDRLGLPRTKFAGMPTTPNPKAFGIIPDNVRKSMQGMDALGKQIDAKARRILDAMPAPMGTAPYKESILSPAAHGDNSFLGTLARQGEIGQDTYDLMSRRYGRRTYYDVFDEMMARHGAGDMKGAIDEFASFVVRIEGTEPDRTALGRMWRKIMALPKGIAQYNILNFHGVLGDELQDESRIFFEGHGGALAETGNPVKRTKYLMGRYDPLDEFAAGTGMNRPNFEMAGHRTGVEAAAERTPLHNAVMFGRGKGTVAERVTGILTGIFDNKTLRYIRNSNDILRRKAVFMDTVQKEYVPRRADWLEHASGLMEQAGLSRDSFDHLPDLFTTNQAREAALSAGADEKLANRIARNWRQELNGMRARGFAEQNRVLFDFSNATKADEILNTVFYYHFWMTRAYPAYASMAIRNPEFLALWYRTWMASEKQAREQGLPPAFTGRLRFMGSVAGFYASMNPWYVLAPVDPGSIMGATNGNASLFDKASSIVAFNPAVSMAAAVLGASNSAPDPLMTYSIRKYVGTFDNFARAHGWIGDKSLDNAPYQQGLVNTVNFIRDKAQNWLQLPIGSKRLTDDPNAYNMDMLGYVARDVIVEKTGVPFDQWTTKEWDRWNAAHIAIVNQDSSNDDANEAFARWMDAKAANDAAAFVSPGGSRLSYGPRDQSRAASAAGWSAVDAGATPTPNEQGAMDFKTSAQSTGAAAPLLNLDTQYGKLGTPWSQDLSGGWASLAYDDTAGMRKTFSTSPKLGASYIQVGGRWVALSDIAAMPADQRKALADQWVAERTNPTGGTKGTADLNTLRDSQSAFKTANPTYGQYAEWKAAANKYPGGLTQWMADARKGNPNYDAYLSASKNPEKAALSMNGYFAFNGTIANVYGAPTQSVRDMSQVPYNPAASATGGTGGTGGQTVTLSRPDSLRKSISDYTAKMTAAAPYLPTDSSGKTVDLASLPPAIAQAYVAKLAERGITIPSLPSKVATYYEWVSLQPQGSDTSAEAFFAWLDQSQGTAGYNLSPAAADYANAP